MSILNLKWTKGAPEKVMPGMVLRCSGVIILAGTRTDPDYAKRVIASCTEYSQAISGYELDWLEDMGVPAKAAV